MPVQPLSAQEVIKKLALAPLPFEGGYFRRTYENGSAELAAQAVGIEAAGKRKLCTAIYYLVTPESFSALHRVKSDELFHFYLGDSVEMIQLDANGKLTKHAMGTKLLEGEVPQLLVPRNVWQGLRLRKGGSWALLGTTVSPGFEYEDFELADRKALSEQFPAWRSEIEAYTRN